MRTTSLALRSSIANALSTPSKNEIDGNWFGGSDVREKQTGSKRNAKTQNKQKAFKTKQTARRMIKYPPSRRTGNQKADFRSMVCGVSISAIDSLLARGCPLDELIDDPRVLLELMSNTRGADLREHPDPQLPQRRQLHSQCQRLLLRRGRTMRCLRSSRLPTQVLQAPPPATQLFPVTLIRSFSPLGFALLFTNFFLQLHDSVSITLLQFSPAFSTKSDKSRSMFCSHLKLYKRSWRYVSSHVYFMDSFMLMYFSVLLNSTNIR